MKSVGEILGRVSFDDVLHETILLQQLLKEAEEAANPKYEIKLAKEQLSKIQIKILKLKEINQK